MTANLLLARMDEDDRAALESLGRVVPLPQGQVLFEPEDELPHAHFLMAGVVSMVITMADGTAVESHMVGREGLVEWSSHAAPQRAVCRAVVQIPGQALRLDAGQLRELARTRSNFRAVLDLNAARAAADLQQTAACNAVHRLEPRLARWLLNSHDRAGVDVLPLTQEFLGEMLGAQRTTVTAIASALQREGTISYKRGRITVLDRKALERASCECYAASQRRAKLISRAV